MKSYKRKYYLSQKDSKEFYDKLSKEIELREHIDYLGLDMRELLKEVASIWASKRGEISYSNAKGQIVAMLTEV